ncbi:hypothetical protein A1OE_1165 [Candidatus Endolissoclinum faulkneri L2]|uniref:Uncharacterized protein n=1 Tax=Candidatus Endolissoclinum faulkneri L2 TaxID=1193729 RepID=K7Z5L3_9PROT|nr:hypothetical protein A1OE_1165 [Candidatus Endolissoclinum faulkneri L2]
MKAKIDYLETKFKIYLTIVYSNENHFGKNLSVLDSHQGYYNPCRLTVLPI